MGKRWVLFGLVSGLSALFLGAHLVLYIQGLFIDIERRIRGDIATLVPIEVHRAVRGSYGNQTND